MAIKKMGLSDVRFETIEGKLRQPSVSTNEEISCLVFDTSTQPDLFKKGYGKENIKNINEGDILVLNEIDDIKKFGIIPFSETPEGKQTEDVNFMYGVPHYHISEFYRARQNKDALLYVMFADCSKDWGALSVVQNATNGMAFQIGVYTEQSLFDKEGVEGKYGLRLVDSLEEQGASLDEEHAPAVILLQANSAILHNEEGDSANKIDIDKIPDGNKDSRSRVSVVLGQSNNTLISDMQKANPTKSPVGCIGLALGCTSVAKVCDSIAWVGKFNVFGERMQRVELGFGDVNLTDEGDFISTNAFESFKNKRPLNNLANNGYIFLIKHAGIANGVYFSSDQTLSDGDFDSISNNRTIFKTQRLARQALLPFLNHSVIVSNVDGTLTQTSISDYTNALNRAFEPMVGTEISGRKITIDPKQKILENDVLLVEYGILPKGKSKQILVKQSFVINTK